MSFEHFGLLKEITRAVNECGYREPTQIQTETIPLVLQKKDILGGAQTGTGKTASFSLPLLHLVSQAKKGNVPMKALILVPTRELANQVYESISTYGKYLPLKYGVVFGGMGIKPQMGKLRRGVDVLVATPGRLLDLVNRTAVDLSTVGILVLDEADCMLDMGFIHDIRKIIELLPKKRQNLMFSATFSSSIQKLADGILKSPEKIEVAKSNSISDQIRQLAYPVDREKKTELLTHLITSNNWKQVLVFTRTKHAADRLSRDLDLEGIRSSAIHGDKRQAVRTKTLLRFKKGGIQVLVATDVAARGIDIHQLSHVVNFELPLVASDYVHRIGRTGRAGSDGEAVSLVCVDEKSLLREIEDLIKTKLTKIFEPGFEVDESILPKPLRRQRKAGNFQGPSQRRPERNKKPFHGKYRDRSRPYK